MESARFAAERPPARLPAAIESLGEPDLPRLHEEDLKTRKMPTVSRPEGQDHATYMAEQMAALHDDVEHMDDWTPDTLPVPPVEIDAAAVEIKRALSEKSKKGT
jgi:hypothetical protein